MLDQDELLRIFQDIADGKLTPEEASLKFQPQPSANTSRPRGRPPKPPSIVRQKRQRGRPKLSPNDPRYGMILSIWVTFHDRMPKMKLRELLATALCVEESTVGRLIARINRLADDPRFFVGRAQVGNALMVLAASVEEMSRVAPFCQTPSALPFYFKPRFYMSLQAPLEQQ